MGKTEKFNEQHIQEHTPSLVEKRGRNWKYKKASKANKNELSSKLRHGHFTKLHIWPLRDEGKKGHKV
jgi:hypothetical protein